MRPDPEELRVLTWNLWWRFGPWRERQVAIEALLAEVDADLIGLQEVWSAPDRNFAASLADGLDLHSVWRRSPAQEQWQRRLGDDRVEIGNAVLSRWPIVDTAQLTLPASAAADRPTVLYASIQAPFGVVPFFTTQLSSAPDLSAVRCAQVAEVARFVAQRATTDFPPVVTGDMNSEPDSDEMRLLCGHKTAPAVPGLVLVDAWRYSGDPASGVTWDRRNPFVLATHEPSARIDYVLVGIPGPEGRGHVRTAMRVGDAPVCGVWPSDHAGVLAELAT